MTTTEPTLSPSDTQRLTLTADTWKRKLLDLTKRNRALNFKIQTVSTITMVDELPAVVFARIWIKGASMRFGAVEETAQPPALAVPATEPLPLGTDVVPEPPQPEIPTEPPLELDLPTETLQPEVVPLPSQPIYSEADQKTRQYDSILQTSSTPEKLDKSLRRLADQARLTLEEQGINPLFLALGMLHYKESADSTEFFQAPLILLPVELTRKSARMGYVVTASGDDPILNPALAEHLRRSYGLALPDLPDAASLDEDYDLQKLLAQIAEATEGMKGRIVKDDIYLGLFSFQKFVMYKDIEQNAAAIASHRIVQQLVLHNAKQYSGLPSEVQALELDQDFAPEKTFQIVDADSSQLRAIAAVSRNYDLVLEGPPGTGKSQTITNLIAQALAAGKSVLFVAEKNAALKVVHQRLVSAGLGDFCLELHSTKANKRAVMAELARSLDASLKHPANSNAASQRLPSVRNTLTNYVQVLHDPVTALNLSPYQVMGLFGGVSSAPRWKYTGPVDSIAPERLTQIVRELGELAETAQLIGDPRLHPWRDTSKTFYTEDDFDLVRELCQKALAELTNITNFSRALEAQLSAPLIHTRADVQNIIAAVDVISRSPGVPAPVLSSEAWNDAPPQPALILINEGRDLHTRAQTIGQVLSPSVYAADHTADIAYIRAKSQGVSGLVAWLDSRYRAIEKQWKAYRLPAFRGSLLQQADLMSQAVQINQDRLKLTSNYATAQTYFGPHWRGEDSNWDNLIAYTQFVVEFRRVYRQASLGQGAITLAQTANPNITVAHQLRVSVATFTGILKSLITAIGWPENYLFETAFSSIEERITGLLENMSRVHQWIAFEVARRRAATDLTTDLINQAMLGAMAFTDLAPAFQRGFYQKWLVSHIQAEPPLLEFNTLTHEQRVAEFRKLDQNVLLENRASLIGNLRDRVQAKLQADNIGEAMTFLRREMARQKRLSPLRRTFKQAGAAIRAIKPCFMMSPLTVAQLLEADHPTFDLVIFDEASQLPAEDAVGAIIRGQQLVVVGDPKQLPPTNFFEVMSGQVLAPMGEDSLPIYEDGESVLEEFTGAGAPTSRLKWHYRSAHESLIYFSNLSFYDGELYTFPSVEFGSDKLGLRFEYVENGTYEGKGLNIIEARRVVDAIVEHVRTSPELSLGVGTFNIRQQLAVQDELEQRRRADPELDAYFNRATDEPFFVKNLENIQGDERDVIFISVTYGKGIDGRLRYNFGPLNGENGWRRLNVLVSRARRRMRVFSSIRADDINPIGLTSAGARLLRDFLKYAEYGRLDETSVATVSATESPFEHDVYTELTRRNISVVPQVGAAGYRIDLGVLDDELPGRYICGIECDGVAYHASETARDRDRLRQEVLEDRGWIIYRIWSTDWFKDRAGQINRILSLIEQAREAARNDRLQRDLALAAIPTEPVTITETSEFLPDALPDLTLQPVVDTAPDPQQYARPSAPLYQFAESKGRFGEDDILRTSLNRLVEAVAEVAAVEGPIRIDDLTERVASFWNKKPGKRISQQILLACDSAIQQKLILIKDNFVFGGTGAVRVRSRATVKCAPDQISQPEYQEAILTVLRTGHTFPRAKLISETRALLGFGRTTPSLEALIDQAIATLLAQSIIGEGSSGIALRK